MTSPLGQNRGGTPIGVRLLLEARPCKQHGRLKRASVGVPYPFAFASFCDVGEVGRSAGKKQVPPLLFLERGSFSPLNVAVIASSNANARRERRRLSVHMLVRRGGFRPKIVANPPPKTQSAPPCAVTWPLVRRKSAGVRGFRRVGVSSGEDVWTQARPSAFASF